MAGERPQLAGRVESTPRGLSPFRVVFTETGAGRIVAVHSVGSQEEGRELIEAALAEWRRVRDTEDATGGT